MTKTDIVFSNIQSIIDILHFFNKVQDIHWLDGHRFPTNPIVTNTSTSHLWKDNFSK